MPRRSAARSVPDDQFGVDPMAPRVRYDVAVAAALPWAAGILAVCYLALVFVRPLVLAPAVSRDPIALSVSALTTAVLLASIALAFRRRGMPLRLAHPLTMAVVCVVAVDSLAEMIWSGDPRGTVTIALAVTAAGAALLSTGWFLSTIGVVWAGWLVVATSLDLGPALRGWLLSMVAATVLGAMIMLSRRRGLDALAGALQHVAQAAVRDPLTGLTNRRGLVMLADELVALADRDGDVVSCTLIDIDGLKAVNDVHGHDAGDLVIVLVADALRSAFRASDVVGRWGGDEFVVVARGCGPDTEVLEERVHAYLTRTWTRFDMWTPAISAGRALLPDDAADLAGLFDAADVAMYARRAARRSASVVAAD